MTDARAQGARPIIIIKKKGGHGGHHGGAWKVAYADFVTAMMALFMVLWLVSQTDQEEREVISHYFRTGIWPEGGTSLLEMGNGIKPDENGITGDPIESAVLSEQSAFEQTEADLLKIVDATPELRELKKNFKVRTIDRGLLIEVVDGGEDALFNLSSAELKPKMVDLLKAAAQVLIRLSNPIEIHGYTDARPFPKGALRDNWQLSYERAANARNVLEKAGLAENRFGGVFAHGATELHNPKDPLDAANRRIALLAVRQAKGDRTLTNAPLVTRASLAQKPEDAAAPSRQKN